MGWKVTDASAFTKKLGNQPVKRAFESVRNGESRVSQPENVRSQKTKR